eukprot:COSAG02_NODE_34662_length_480_cov_1.209974_1_plen_57_part_00
MESTWAARSSSPGQAKFALATEAEASYCDDTNVRKPDSLIVAEKVKAAKPYERIRV